MKITKKRLDQLVFEKGFAESRERAKALIMSGQIFLNGQRADKPGLQVDPAAEIALHGAALPFVSRGGYKLNKALAVFPVDPGGKICVDCGASTGGFTDVLLQHGAARVYAVDVGYGQLAWKLRNDARVVNLERTNLRYITEEMIPEPIDLAVMDVSFISVTLILPVVKKLLKENADYICLIKPQFEAGREQVGKKGVVRDPAVHCQVITSVLDAARSFGYSVQGLDYSPITGPEGNIEFICYLKNGQFPEPEINIEQIVRSAHLHL